MNVLYLTNLAARHVSGWLAVAALSFLVSLSPDHAFAAQNNAIVISDNNTRAQTGNAADNFLPRRCQRFVLRFRGQRNQRGSLFDVRTLADENICPDAGSRGNDAGNALRRNQGSAEARLTRIGTENQESQNS